MADAKMLARANRVLHRLDVLDDAMANVDAFCALLKDLNARDQSIVKFPHSAAIHMVRAGILRAAIGTVIACLDPEDRRGNSASIGQILGMLKDTELVDLFAGSEATRREATVGALRQVRKTYYNLTESPLYKRGKRLRNDTVAHTLIPDNPSPPVSYEDIYELRDVVGRIVTDLHAACGRTAPRFLDRRVRTAEHAKIFWETHLLGMGRHDFVEGSDAAPQMRNP